MFLNNNKFLWNGKTEEKTVHKETIGMQLCDKLTIGKY
jgi:hypothetical protein